MAWGTSVKCRHDRSFQTKLTAAFLLFSIGIFTLLWLLETVFLQGFYNRMVEHEVRSAATELAGHLEDDDLAERITLAASDSSLLVFVTDTAGTILQNADEHSSLYGPVHSGSSDDSRQNPYLPDHGPMSWEMGAYRLLPSNYPQILEELGKSPDHTWQRVTADGANYVYAVQRGEKVLYVSSPLGAVGSTVRIIRFQLLIVTLISILFALFLSRFFSRRFSRPLSLLRDNTKHLADGLFDPAGTKGFCTELDGLSDSLVRTASSIQQLESARKELMGNVSHDLRTPLTLIRGYAEMVRNISWPDEAARNQDLGIIIRESDRLKDLVNDIIDYSAYGRTEIPPEARIEEPDALVRGVIGQFAPIARQKGIRIETKPSGEAPSVHGEYKLIERVLYNLVDNAMQHAGDGKRVEIASSFRDGKLHIEVKDWGDLIPSEEIPLVWDRYFTTRSKRCGGRSGLGLAIVKQILAAHHAPHGVTSSRQTGTCFWFDLFS